MVAVGYGREAEDGSQTLGGRSVDELSANITTISQELNTDATTIVLKGKFKGAVFDISLIFSLE
jgi:hypothetical protein